MTTKVIMRNVEYVKIGKDRINSMIKNSVNFKFLRFSNGQVIGLISSLSRDMAIKNRIKIDTFVLKKSKRRIRCFFPNNKLLK